MKMRRAPAAAALLVVLSLGAMVAVVLLSRHSPRPPASSHSPRIAVARWVLPLPTGPMTVQKWRVLPNSPCLLETRGPYQGH
jgi:hypothetical protein